MQYVLHACRINESNTVTGRQGSDKKQYNIYRRAVSNEMPSMLQNQKGNSLEKFSSNMGVRKAQSKITLPEHVTEQYNFKINSECRDG
jgi:hypothetical protein